VAGASRRAAAIDDQEHDLAVLRDLLDVRDPALVRVTRNTSFA